MVEPQVAAPGCFAMAGTDTGCKIDEVPPAAWICCTSMANEGALLHITFGHSAAMSPREALEQLGRQERGKVIAHALVRSCSEFYQTSDLFLWSRLRTLVEEGVIEGRGDMQLMHENYVRRPAKR